MPSTEQLAAMMKYNEELAAGVSLDGAGLRMAPLWCPRQDLGLKPAVSTARSPKPRS
jgi:hypothetical protein